MTISNKIIMMKQEYPCLVAILSFCISSITMTLANEFVSPVFKHPMPFLLLTLQTGFALALIHLLQYYQLVTVKKLNPSSLKKWVPVPLLMTAMMLTQHQSAYANNLPILALFKSMSIVLVAIGEQIIFKSVITSTLLLSFSLMMLSTVIGGWNDLDSTVAEYLWTIAHNVISVLFWIYMRYAIRKLSFSNIDIIYYNSLLPFPKFFVTSLLTENWSRLSEFYIIGTNTDFWQSIIIITGFLIMNFILSYTSGWCIKAANGTTFSIVETISRLQIPLLIMTYTSGLIRARELVSLLIALFALFIYVFAKISQKKGATSNVETCYEKLVSGGIGISHHHHSVLINEKFDVEGANQLSPIYMKSAQPPIS